MDAADIADLAELYIQRQARLEQHRQQLKARLFRVHQAILRWEEWQDENERPLPLRRPMPTPLLSYEFLKALRALPQDKVAKIRVKRAD